MDLSMTRMASHFVGDFEWKSEQRACAAHCYFSPQTVTGNKKSFVFSYAGAVSRPPAKTI
jgi:hypothetical protein